MTVDRPDVTAVRNGSKAPLPFSAGEYDRRLAALRAVMAASGLDAVLLTSMASVACHSGFLYCAFGRPYGLVVTPGRSVVIAALIDGGQPWPRTRSGCR